MDIELELDDINECCVCLESIFKDCIEMDCCNNKIHQMCLFLVFITYDMHDEAYIPCPLCREPMQIFDKFSIAEIIRLFENLSEKLRLKFYNKKNKIIYQYNYPNVIIHGNNTNIVLGTQVSFYKVYIMYLIFVLFLISAFGIVFLVGKYGISKT
jgi:hypothetical protein